MRAIGSADICPRCSVLASSASEVDSSHLFGLYLSPLYIVHCSLVSYIELAVAKNLYSLSSGEGWGEVCGLSIFKTDGDIAGTESGRKAGRVVYCAYTGIGIRGIESLIEEHYAVVAVEHQIAGMDCAGPVRGGGERGGQVMVFLIAVQFVHRDGKG